MRALIPLVFAATCLISHGSPLMAGGDPLTTIKISTNGFCGYWRFTIPNNQTQIDPSGKLADTCEIKDINGQNYLYGPCDLELENVDYTFEIKAMQNSAQVSVSPRNGVTLTNPTHDLALAPKTSAQGDHNLDILTTTIDLQRGRFKGNISFEYINPAKECQNHQTTLPKGAKWYLTTGSRANTLIALDRYDIAYPTSQSAIRARGATRLEFKTVDVTITPNSGASKWGIHGVTDTMQNGALSLPLVPVGYYELFAKNGKTTPGAVFSLTGDCEIQPKILLLPGLGKYYLSADCSTSGFEMQN